MNAAHLHLAINHFPIVLFLFATVVLLFSFIAENSFWKKKACIILICGALTAIPAYLSGEGAEHLLKANGVSKDLIKPHEKVAKIALAASFVSGVAAILAYLAIVAGSRFAKPLTWVLAVLAIGTSASMLSTASDGGKISHPEIRSETLNSIPGNNILEKKHEKKHHDDDQ